jgi:hypothetical protein
MRLDKMAIAVARTCDQMTKRRDAQLSGHGSREIRMCWTRE